MITILEVFDDHEKHGQYHSSPLYSSKLTTDVAFSPRFERIWLESKKRPPEYMAKKTANAALRSQYSLRLYSWAKKYVEEAPLSVWANFQQRALDVAILEINTKTDLKIKLKSTERSKHRRVVALKFTIKPQAIPKARRSE